MVRCLVTLTTENNKVVNILKAREDLKNRSEAINIIIRQWNENRGVVHG